LDYLKDRFLARGGKTACGFGPPKGGTTTKTGTSLWVPACQGNLMGTREKKRKAGRVGGRKAPSSCGWLDDLALPPGDFGLRPVAPERPADREGGYQSTQLWWSCQWDLDRDCCSHCPGMLNLQGNLELGYLASSPQAIRDMPLGYQRRGWSGTAQPSQAVRRWTATNQR
jgi:hypothetical protein